MHAAIVKLEATIPRLTKTQANRLVARVQGASLPTIAQAEGVTKQSVAETLRAPAVQEAVSTILGRPMEAVDKATGKQVNIVCKALEMLVEAMENATRFVPSGGGRFSRVPDYPRRVAAASRILSLVDRPASVHNRGNPDGP